MPAFSRCIAAAVGVAIALLVLVPSASAAEEEVRSTQEIVVEVSATTWGALAVVVAAAVIWFGLDRSRSNALALGAERAGNVLVLLLGTGAVLVLAGLAVNSANAGTASGEAVSRSAQSQVDATATPAEGDRDGDETADSSPRPTPRATAGPTPRPQPTARPTVRPAPTATPRPAVREVAPVPTVAAGVFVTTPLDGLVRVPVGDGVQFFLGTPRPVSNTPGHTAIYLDEQRRGEVDIFVPFELTETGRRPRTVAGVVDAMQRAPLNLDEIGTTTVDGYRAVRLAGSPSIELERIFETSTSTIDVPLAGWHTPGNLQVWVIDAPSGPIVVTAEALVANQAFFDDALVMAEDLLATMSIL